MKKNIKLLSWILFSILLQTGLLFYLNNYYFSQNTRVTFSEVAPKKQESMKPKVSLPANAQNISLSPTGKYICYTLNDSLYVLDIASNSSNKVTLPDSINSCFFSWNNLEDKIIICQTVNSSSVTGIKIFNYLAKDNSISQALDYSNKAKTYFFDTNNLTVKDIKLNTMNTIIYIKAANSQGKICINRLDISDRMYKLSLNSNDLGNFFIDKSKDEIVYEVLSSNKVFITNKSSILPIEVPNVDNLKLLYIDKNDTLYLGELKNGLVVNIFYSTDDSYSNFSKVQLSDSYKAEDIHFSDLGDIYTVYGGKYIENLKTSHKQSLAGNFIDIKNNKVLSLSDNNLINITDIQK